MQLSPDSIEELLYAGGALQWLDPKTNRESSIRLRSREQKCLFKFLMGSPVRDGKSLDEWFIADLKNAYLEPDEPQVQTQSISNGPVARTWLLKNIKTYGFGGLNTSAKVPFEYAVNTNSVCIEGPNGSGKSSLAAAILWALTGKRANEHLPASDAAVPQPVRNKQERPVGLWPPLAAYPRHLADFANGAKVGVELTFINLHTSEEARILRRHSADGKMTVTVDPRIVATPGFNAMVNTGLLLPSRVTQLRLNERRGSLTDAIQALTGLDRIAKLGDFVDELCNGNLDFRRYGRRLHLQERARQFVAAMQKAEQVLPSQEVEIKRLTDLRLDGLSDALAGFYVRLAAKAEAAVATLSGELASPVTDSALLVSVQMAINELPHAFEQCPTTKLLEQLAAADISGVPQALAKAKEDFAAAEERLSSQQNDIRLRLKIMAARWHVEQFPDADTVDNCPLCEQAVFGKLGNQLFELRGQGEIAEQTLEQACVTISARLRGALPAVARDNLAVLSTLNPAAAIGGELAHSLLSQDRYKLHLAGTTNRISQAIDALAHYSANFPLPISAIKNGSPNELKHLISCVERAGTIRKGWAAARPQLMSIWRQFLEGDSRERPGAMSALERCHDALSEAQPLREAAGQIQIAIEHLSHWTQIKDEQELRDNIATALSPLKDLRLFVEAQAADAIHQLSAKIGQTLNQIYVQDSLMYEATTIDRQAVSVRGTFTGDYNIDAALVANTSWLRAFLWAFLFAYRSQLLSTFTTNPLPLLLLDDPQATFDQHHRRKWAELLTGLQLRQPTDPEFAQVLITTHDLSFAEALSSAGFKGRMATIQPASHFKGNAMILDVKIAQGHG